MVHMCIDLLSRWTLCYRSWYFSAPFSDRTLFHRLIGLFHKLKVETAWRLHSYTEYFEPRHVMTFWTLCTGVTCVCWCIIARRVNKIFKKQHFLVWIQGKTVYVAGFTVCQDERERETDRQTDRQTEMNSLTSAGHSDTRDDHDDLIGEWVVLGSRVSRCGGGGW